MLCIIRKERIAFWAQVEGTRGEIFATSPIALRSRCKCVLNEPIPTYPHSWPQCQSVLLKQETDRARRNGETEIGGRYAMRRVVLRPGMELSAPGVSLTALTERLHSDGAIPPGRKYQLLMYITIFPMDKDKEWRQPSSPPCEVTLNWHQRWPVWQSYLCMR